MSRASMKERGCNKSADAGPKKDYKWKPDQSGNPTGRKKGFTNKVTMLAHDQGELLWFRRQSNWLYKVTGKS